MPSVDLPIRIRRECIDRLNELMQIPMPREGKRDGHTLSVYMRDAREAQRYALRLLDALGGFTADPDDVHAAGQELRTMAREALTDSATWLLRRKEEDWK